ncbi:MATE family efflux transporter [Evansella clarkii]|uniref:MATE family efflux transporter n=1 Tax=Evansella clarkii TaxID=79879 RepID=UPI000996ADB4|nr:MATE family efflux transporter [Evansella clarkii]
MKGEAASVLSNNETYLTHRNYLALAVPLIIAGISTPILGAVDTAVVGRLPDPAAIGGVAIGAVIFNTMYWLLGFLRVSTSGFTAQAEGAKNEKEIILSFLRPMILAVLFGMLFIILQQPVLKISLVLFGGSDAVSTFAATYFSIRIWGAPFLLLSYVVIGWLIGMGKVRLSLIAQVSMNLLNIILNILFVLGFGWGVAGVAYATVISEVGVVLFGLMFILWKNKRKIAKIKPAMVMESEAILKMIKVNSDLFLRTICLLAMTIIFTSKGASMGEVTLAANAILLQIHYIMAYLFGGLANASSIITGRAIGGKQQALYHRAFSLSAQWGMITAIILSFIIFVLGDQIVALFTTIEDVRVFTSGYLIWMVVFPVVGYWGLQLEGIFSGATEAKSIRNSMALALILFLLAIWLLEPLYGNHGIWIAFVLFSLARSVFLSLFVPKLTRSKFGF